MSLITICSASVPLARGAANSNLRLHKVPKKIADIKRKPPSPTSPKERIVDFLRAHPEDAFTWWELGQATGLLPKVDSFGSLAGFLIGTSLGAAMAGRAAAEALDFTVYKQALNELITDGVVEHDERRLYFWLRQSSAT